MSRARAFVMVEPATAAQPPDRALHLDFVGVIYSDQRLWELRDNASNLGGIYQEPGDSAETEPRLNLSFSI